MACILRPEWNFFNGFIRCLLPVDVEVKVKMMQRINMFWRDRISQIIKFNPWSTRLCPYPSVIQKMKTYLEIEGTFGPKPRLQPQTQLQQTHLQPSSSSYPQNTNPITREAPGPKTSDKRRRTVFTKRRYKVRVIAQPIPTNPTPTELVNSTAPTPQ